QMNDGWIMLICPGQSLTISCQVSGYSLTDNSYATGWIRQREALEWIGFIYSDASRTDYTSSVQERAEVTRDNSNSMVYLRLSNLKPEDSAVYYCARETHWSKEAERLEKNLIQFIYFHKFIFTNK
uniref:Immunoglobulin heavy variable 9-2 n=1 Tax=Sander lucioperca TaxID=283035 RepID=A0A8D0D339_SANLU